ncbi:hypothetical protein QZM22_06230 [Burkholderia oklahomensis]|uniref:hypothetical protein n=1 Tax=Burkholderia oklahomensis TaxID=342113 RepID=UPI00264A8B78|nr:hypothetical protein [Burkholderia oklahomensis]MDN7672128.1 hypothetical protein [Burkholderia oklahomensis]
MAPLPDRFNAIAERHAAPGQEGARADAIGQAWEREMLALRMRAPDTPRTAELIDLSLDFLIIQRCVGPIPAGTLARLRESALTVAAAPESARPPERKAHADMQRFNLLFPLLWLQASMPRTAVRLDCAIATLLTIRNGLSHAPMAGREAATRSTPDSRTASSE